MRMSHRTWIFCTYGSKRRVLLEARRGVWLVRVSQCSIESVCICDEEDAEEDEAAIDD